MSPEDQAIIDGAAQVAREGLPVDLDTIPQRLWPQVCDITREIGFDRWRERGWTVTSVTCDKGCCPGTLLSPPGSDPAKSLPSRCMRGVKHIVLSSFREAQLRALRENPHADLD